jgi:dolichol-phosphate mannosyltransferase
MRRILIVIPTYNEADNIDALFDSINILAAQAKYLDIKLLIADDNSTDGTSQKIKHYQKKNSNITLLTGEKKGLGRAYLRSFDYALKNESFDVLIMMDSDLSHNPSDIPRLLADINKGIDYVIGSRYVVGGSVDDNWPLSRKLMSRSANFIAKRLVGVPDDIQDMTSGYKAIGRRGLEKINIHSINARGYVFQVSLLHAFLVNDLKVSEIPIRFTARDKGDSKLKLRDILEFVYANYKLNPAAPIQTFVRFAFVGFCGAIVNLLTLVCLIEVLNMNVLLAALLAIELSIIFNFFLHQFYTFKGFGAYRKKLGKFKSRLLNRLIMFNIGTAGGAAISFLTFSLLYKVFNVPYLPADIIAIALATGWNYSLSTKYIWRKIDTN